jgi:hypothetical protein
VRVGGDDTWVFIYGVCNIFFCSIDVFVVARGALLIFFGSIFNFIFGWMGAMAFGCGVLFFYLGQQLKLLELLFMHPDASLPLKAPWSSSSSPSSSQTLLLLFLFI